ncbi:MAG: hypothetical protein IKT40_06310 [Bacilli bacterium]|nr:hypothetical protein [Bacilli bacterium]
MIKVKLKNKEIVQKVYSDDEKKRLIEEVKKQAHRVNQQMVRLEKSPEMLKGSYAYMNAQAELAENKSIRSGKFRKGKETEGMRFDESQGGLKSMTVEELIEEKKILDRFEKSVTSGKKGIEQVRKNKQKATMEYAQNKVEVEINKTEYDKLMSAFENRRVSKLLNEKLGSKTKFNKLVKSLKGSKFDMVLKALEEAEEYLKTHDDVDKPKVKTEEEADALNELFGNVEIFGFQDYAPTLTDGLDKITTKAKFGGGLI